MSLLEAILIIGLYQTILFGGIVLSKKGRNHSDFYLAAIFLVNGLTLFLGYMEIYNRNHGYPFPFLINTSAPFILLHGPILWFYVNSLTIQHFRLRARHIIHAVPFLIVLVLLIFENYSLPAQERIVIDRTEAFRKNITFPVIITMIAVITQGYFLWGLWLIRRYKKKIYHYFSEVSSMDLAWLRILIITAIIFYAGNSILYILDYIFNLLPYHVLQTTGYAYASVFVLVLGYRGYRQGNIFRSRQVAIDLDATVEGNRHTPDQQEEDEEVLLVKELLEVMQKDKPFLNPELTLANLASRLRVSPDRLSSVLNGRINRNFFDFVNHYRIEEFKKVSTLAANKNITIMGMAWDAGFNSKATFNRVFKKATGITPGEYINQAK